MISRLEVQQRVLEPAIMACSQLTILDLCQVNCPQLSLRDLFYLKHASFDLVRFYQVVSISNCPNLEVLRAKSLIKLPTLVPATTVSPISKLRELSLDIAQNQEEYVNNDATELELDRLKELHTIESEFLAHINFRSYTQQ